MRRKSGIERRSHTTPDQPATAGRSSTTCNPTRRQAHRVRSLSTPYTAAHLVPPSPSGLQPAVFPQMFEQPLDLALAQMLAAAAGERRDALARATRRGLAGLALVLLATLAPQTARAGATVMDLDSAHVMAQAHHGEMFLRPRAIALDLVHHEVIVANTGLGRVEYFDYRTWPRGFFTHTVPGPDGRPLAGEPIALAVDAQGRVLVSDIKAPYVDVLDYRGRSLQQLVLPAPDDTAGARFGPGAIAVAPDGRVFVASRGAGLVHVFDRTFKHVGSWGVTGTDSTRIVNITALAVDSAGRVFVACAMTVLAVQVFDAGGQFLFGFGRHDLGPGNFSLPSGLAFTTGGRVCVSDAIRQVVQVFESDGAFVGAVGNIGVHPGEFREPSALAGDGHGMLALAEKSGGRFQIMWLR